MKRWRTMTDDELIAAAKGYGSAKKLNEFESGLSKELRRRTLLQVVFPKVQKLR